MRGLSNAGDPTGGTVGFRRAKVICGSIIEPCLLISVIGMLPICSFSLSLTQFRPTSSSPSSFLVVLELNSHKNYFVHKKISNDELINIPKPKFVSK